MLGIYGKHPAFGDFISHGVLSQFQAGMVPWIGQILAEVRDHLGGDWKSVYDNASPLRFWIGTHVFGESSLCGVMLFGQDKVGRRYPLVIVEDITDLSAPVLDRDQTFYDSVQTNLEQAFQNNVIDVGALIAELGGNNTPTPPAEPEPATLWAANPDPQIKGLLEAVCTADHQRATEHRSYWWSAGHLTSASTFLATQGLPDMTQFVWLMNGIQTQALQKPALSDTDTLNRKPDLWP